MKPLQPDRLHGEEIDREHGVSVSPDASFGAPTALFQVRVAGGVSPQRSHYVPNRDGRRFLINTPTGDAAMVPITVVLNWTADLKP